MMNLLPSFLRVMSIVLIAAKAAAQDPHFSQFYANRIYLNPSYAGFDPGKTFNLNFRNQWPGIPDGDVAASATSFRTVNATGDFRLPCFSGIQHFSMGLAGSIFRDAAGRAPLVGQGAGVALSAAKRLKFDKYRSKLDYFDIRVGAQMSVMQRKINHDFFIYSNQLDPKWGLTSDPSLLNLRSELYPNLNAGMMVNFGNKRFTQSIGVSISNVLEPNQSLRDAPSADILSRRYTGHVGTTVAVSNNLYVSPQARADFQSGFDLGLFSTGVYLQNEQMYGGMFFQWNKNTLNQISTISPSIQSVNHLIFNIGLDLESIVHLIGDETLEHSFILGATYDLSLSGLGQQTTKGGVEFSLRMFFDGGKRYSCLEEKQYTYKRCPITH